MDHLLGDEDRCALPGNQRRRDDDVSGGHVLRHHFLLLLIELFRLRLGVTALVLCVFRSAAQLGELGAQALHLLLDGWAGIVRLHDSAEPPRCADRLQPRNARPDHENPRRGNRASGGHEQREELRQTARRD